MIYSNIRAALRSKLYNSERAILILFFILTLVLLTDGSFVKVSDLVRPQSSSSLLMLMELFFTICIICIPCQYILLGSLNLEHESNIKVGKVQIATLLSVVKIIQITLTIVLLIVIIQILTAPSYSTILLFLSTVLSYSLSIFMMGIASRFFSWFKSYKNTVILFYSLAASALVVNTGLIFGISMSILPDAPAQVGEHVA